VIEYGLANDEIRIAGKRDEDLRVGWSLRPVYTRDRVYVGGKLLGT
jgi:hypothetical protein